MSDMDTGQPHISNLSFGENAVEIAYAEPRDIENLDATGGILRTRVVVCPAHMVEDEMKELIDSAAELLDKILLLERNPTLRR